MVVVCIVVFTAIRDQRVGGMKTKERSPPWGVYRVYVVDTVYIECA
jgi:hypothetical protein